jgi:hypothetical protein
VFDGVFQGEDSAFGLGFVSDVGVSLFHAHLEMIGVVNNKYWVR